MTTRTTNHNSNKHPQQNWTLKNLVVIVIVIYPTTRRVLPPLTSLAHTHTDWHCCCQSKSARQPGENQKKQRVMQMLNGKWKMLSCWRFAVHSTWERHVDWPAQPSRCDVKQNPDQIWYSYLCGIYMHIYIYISIWISWKVIAVQDLLGNQVKKNQKTDWTDEGVHISRSIWILELYISCTDGEECTSSFKTVYIHHRLHWMRSALL